MYVISVKRETGRFMVGVNKNDHPKMTSSPITGVKTSLRSF